LGGLGIELTELWNPHKLPEKEMERDRYIQGQLNLISNKLDRLEKVVSVGLPLSEAEETMERMDNMEREIKIGTSKSAIYGTVLKDIKKDMEYVKKGLEEKSSMKQIMMLNERIKSLEQMYETFSSNKTRDVLLNMVEIMKNLEGRLKTLEEISHSNASLMFETQVHELQGTVTTEKQEKQKGFERVTVPTTAQPVQAMPYKQAAGGQNLKDKVWKFLNKLIGKS